MGFVLASSWLGGRRCEQGIRPGGAGLGLKWNVNKRASGDGRFRTRGASGIRVTGTRGRKRPEDRLYIRTKDVPGHPALAACLWAKTALLWPVPPWPMPVCPEISAFLCFLGQSFF